MSQTYVFTVAITGEDVQDAADALREGVIDIARAQQDGGDNDVHVTGSSRVTP